MAANSTDTLFDLSARPTWSMRAAYGKALVEAARRDPRIVALVTDCTDIMGVTEFAQLFPERYFNVGIAEQNMIGVSAGMASCGLIPFAAGLAPFVSMRSAEQVRTDTGYTNFNVKMAAAYGGISQSIGGSTHHATEDLAILRAMPNLTVIAPADGLEAYKATLAAVNHPGPVYLRLAGRDPDPVVYDEDYDFSIGKAVTLHEGSDMAIIATGTMVVHALLAAEALRREGIGARVLDMHTIKPLDREAIVRAARETGRILTVEEHNVYGGLGGAVAEVVVQECPVPMEIVGIPDLYASVGPAMQLRAKYGLSWNSIADRARQLLSR